MSPVQVEMIKEARRRHKEIFPLTKKPSFPECFTEYNEVLFFWYNSNDNSTHLVHSDMIENN